jgi:predicted anti-sigma-YlaC factor YlaD
MECREARKLVDEAAAGGDSSVVRAVREHAATCAECRAELARAERLQSLLRVSRDATCAPGDLTSSVRRRIVHEHGVPRPAGLPLWLRVPLVTGIAAAVVFAIVFLAGRPPGTVDGVGTGVSQPVVASEPAAPAEAHEALAQAAAWNADVGVFEDNAVAELARADAASYFTTSLDR